MSDPRGGEPLPYELRAELQGRASRVGPTALAVQLDVTEMVLARALAGFAVKGSSVKLIRAGLERAAKDLPPANPMDGAIDRAKARSMGHFVCHACLEIQARGENTGLPPIRSGEENGAHLTKCEWAGCGHAIEEAPYLHERPRTV